MNTASIRSRLHEYIERADDRHLEAIYVLLEGAGESVTYDQATLEMFHQRREAHLAGESKSYTAEESLQLIRSGKR
jgi:hypothetical protein